MSFNTVEYANQLLAENERLKQQVKQLAAELGHVEEIHAGAVFITDDDYEKCPEVARNVIRRLAVMSFSATDAWLNEVRAQSVEMFVKGYAFKLRTSGGGDGYHPEPYHDMADHIEAKCERYAAQLRAGEVPNG